jgi:hypothetical protein
VTGGWQARPDGSEIRQVRTPGGLEVWLRRPQLCPWAQHRPVLMFSVPEWDAFVSAMKSGEYDTAAD